MPDPSDIYLDIETTRDHGISVIGFTSEVTGTVQLYGDDVTAERLEATLPAGVRLFTFNGNSFDIPFILRETGVNLFTRNKCLDLMRICHGRDIKGGQKAIEERIGFTRETKGVRGFHALGLWDRWANDGDERALELLLHYNREDLDGMVAIHRFLDSYFLFDLT